MNAPLFFYGDQYRQPPMLLVREEVDAYGAEPEPETLRDWARAHERIVALGKERLRVGRALVGLPELDAALAAGGFRGRRCAS